MSERSKNRVNLLGRVGRDAELKITGNGTSVAKFSVATGRSVKRSDGTYKEYTDWHSVVLWNAEKIAPLLVKGARVDVEGRLSTRTYEQDGKNIKLTEVVAESLILLSDHGEAPATPEKPAPGVRLDATGGGRRKPVIPDEDLPF